MLMLLLAAALPAIAGIQLGATPGMPECARMVLSSPGPQGTKPPYLMRYTEQCIMLPSADPLNGDGIIFFPPRNMPMIAGFNYVGYSLIEGKIEKVDLSTLDHNHADAIVGQLVEKFGKPAEDRPASTIVMHIAVPDRHVVWHGAGWVATYDSIKTMDRGLLRVETDKAAAAAAARDADAARLAVPL